MVGLKRLTPLLALTIAMAVAVLTAIAYSDANVVLEEYWFTSSTGGPVYPGSSNAVFSVVVRNTGNTTAYGVAVCVSLPPGFHTVNRCSVVGNLTAGDAAQASFRVDVDRSVEPGYYSFNVRVDYSGGSHTYTVTVRVDPYPKPLLRVVDSWAEPLGEANTTGLAIDIVVEAVNASINGGYGWAYLPKGFTPSVVPVDLPSINEGGRARIRLTNIYFSGEPGVYTARLKLVVESTTSDGVTYWTNTSLEFTIALGPLHPLDVRLVDAYWSAGGYPGSKQSQLTLILLNNDYCTVGPLYVRLVDPSGASLGEAYLATTIASKALATVALSVDVGSTSTLRGLLHVYASMNCNGERRLGYKALNISIPVKKAIKPVEVVDARLNPAYIAVNGNATGLQPSIMIRNVAQDTLVDLTVEVTLSPPARFTYGLPRAVVHLSGSYSYGSVVEASLPPITIPVGVDRVEATARIVAVYSAGSARYMVYTVERIVFRLTSVKPLSIIGLWAEYNGEPSPILPGQMGIRLHIRLLNRLDTRIHVDYAVLRLENITSQLVSNGCTPVAGRSSCELVFWLNTSETIRGLVNGSLELTYTVENGGELAVEEEPVTISIGNPLDYSPRIIIVGAWWGQATPSRPYPGSKGVPLTVVVLNIGHYPASTVTVGAAGDVRTVSEAICHGLQPGGTCTATLYVDLASNLSRKATIVFNITYTYTVYGGVYVSSRKYSVSLDLAPVKPHGVMVVDYGWSGGRVYPGSENTVLQLTLANENPFTVAGIAARLECSGGIRAQGYAAGPIQAYGSTTLTMSIDIPPTTRPGEHLCRVEIRYWMRVGDHLVEETETSSIRLKIHSPAEAFKPLKIYLAVPSGNGSRGAPLVLVLGVNDTDASLLYVELALPKGMVDPTTGSRVLVLAPGAAQPPVPTGRPTVSQLAQLLSQTQLQTPGPNTIVLSSTVNVLNLKPGKYTVKAKLFFKDYWGSIHSVDYNLSLLVTGRPTPVDVKLLTPRVIVVNGTATVTIMVVNNGSSPLYDVHVALTPIVPSAFPENGVRYLEALEPGEAKTLTYRIVFNPAGYMGQKTNTFAATVAVVYRDVYGSAHVYNTTISATMLTPPQLLVKEASATYSNGTLTLRVVLVNVGGSTASRSIVYMVAGGRALTYTVAGDIDPGSELPLKLEARVPAKPRTVTVKVVYYDEYNNVYTLKYSVPVENTVSLEHTITSSSGGHVVRGEMLVVASVAGFLAAVAASIYVYLRRHQARLEGAAP